MYSYRPEILDALVRHGLTPRPQTPPQMLRDAVRDLYLHEIRRLRQRLLDGHVERGDYAGEVVELRKRYWVLSVPLQLWTG